MVLPNAYPSNGSVTRDTGTNNLSHVAIWPTVGIADRMIIASGTSARAVSAMAEHLVGKLKELKVRPRTEGERHGDWALIDAGDVIVHLFRPEVRLFYNLERIWATPAQPTKKRRA